MEERGRRATQRILDLTLEIICLLTGEDCTVMTRSGEPLTPMLDSPPHSLITDGKNKKILEVTNQIIELLGEDWECLDAHKDAMVKMEAMVEDQPPLTSPDGSRKRKRNPPERCPLPLYSRSPSQEGPMMLCHSQNKNPTDGRTDMTEVKEEEGTSMESRQSVLKFGVRVIIKEEESTEENNTDGSRKKNPPERFPRPLYSPDSAQEEQSSQKERPTQHSSEYCEAERLYCSSGEESQEDGPLETDPGDSKGTQTNVKVKEEPRDVYLWTDQRCKKKSGASEIGGDGQYRRYKMGMHNKITNPSGENPVTRVHHVQDLLNSDTGEVDLFSYFSPPIAHSTTFGERERFRFSEATERELFSHHSGPTPERPFECSVCGKCFAEKAHLGSHERAHTNERPYSCSVCGRCFGDKSHLAAHEITHAAEKPYSCSMCGKSYAEKSHLVSHERTHSTEKPHQCPVCRRCFAERSHLVNHERSHSSERRYACGMCGKTFSEKGHLANHEKSHATERSFFCFECGKYFSQRGHYNRHQRTHTEAKPFACSECGKSFSQKEYLIKHQRFHTGEKPYSCLACGKCFTDRYDLAKHERIHTGDRPYSCDWCGKGFAQKSNLVRHERVHINPPFMAISIPADGDVPKSNASTE